MKKVLSLILFMPLFNYAQWTPLTTNTTKNLNTIEFSSSNIGLVAGYGGLVLRTTNGLNWDSMSSATTEELNTVSFGDEDTVFIGGTANGGFTTVLKSNDAGLVWGLESADPQQIINDLKFVSSQKGYMAGRKITVGICPGANCSVYINRTLDGGASWQTINATIAKTIINGHIPSNAVWFINDSTGFVVASRSRILKTQNSGTTWQDISDSSTAFSGTTSLYNDVHFIDENVGYVVGRYLNTTSGIILGTTDGGLTWDSTIVSNIVLGVWTVNTNDAYAVGKFGTIYKTTDGGASWILEASSVTSDLNKVTFLNDSLGYIVGDSGVILKTNVAAVVSPLKVSFTISTNDTICLGNTVNFTNTSNGANGNEWFVNNISNTTTANFSYQFNTSGSFEIKLKADSAGVEYDSAIVIITVLQPIANFTTLKDTVSVGYSVDFTNTSNNATHYTWYINNVKIDTTFNLTYLFTNIGNYNIKLIVSNNGICFDDTTKAIYAKNTSWNSIAIQNENPFSLLVYPNPFQDKFNISFDLVTQSDINIELTDIVGKKIFSEQHINYLGTYSKQVELNDIKGVCLLKLQTGNHTIFKQLINTK